MTRVRSHSLSFYNRQNQNVGSLPQIVVDVEIPGFFTSVYESHLMLQQRLGGIIQESITEGQRFALSSDLWRCASISPRCDLLIVLKPQSDELLSKELVLWVYDIIKKCEPQFDIKIRHHHLTNCYGLYITANYTSLLKGAELCHLKKPIKTNFGGGMRDFTFDEAQCFQGLEIRSTFLSGMERSMIVRQMLLMIKAPSPHGLHFRPIYLASEQAIVCVPDGATLVVSLMTQNVVENMLPLHETEILNDLQKRWVFTIFEEQPLEDIKEYFGTEIAMYFAWLGHLTTALWTPAIIGFLMFFFGGFKFSHYSNDEENESTLFGDICFVLFALINCIWSTAYLEMWKRQQAELAFKWGTYELQADELLEDPRPAFKGECLRPNPVSGRLEPWYPAWKHALIRYGITFPITIFILAVLFLTMFCLLQLQDLADSLFKESYYFKWIPYVPMIVYALIIISGDFFYRRLAIKLNDLENYRTDEEYETYLIQKMVSFQCVSAFGSLFYIAFYLNDMKRLQETLATLLITRQLTQNILEIAVPFVMEKFKVAKLTYQMTRSMSEHSLQRHVDAARKRRDTIQTAVIVPDSSETDFLGDGLRQRRNVEDTENGPPKSPTISSRVSFNHLMPNSDGFELTEAELQSLMTVYARPLDDYLEMFIQFGYVLLFSPAFPLAAACALLNNLLEIRVDAFKLCNAVQRPFGRRVKTIGAWQKAMEMMGVAGVMVNCALIGQSGLVQRIWPNMSTASQILFVVALEHVILAAKAWIDTAIPDIPNWIRIETAKVEHWRREAYKRESKLLAFGTHSPTISEQANLVQSPSNSSLKKVDHRNIDRTGYRRARENHSCTPSRNHPNFY